MNDRESLIELLSKAETRENIMSSHGKPLGFYDVKMVYHDCVNLLADNLISHGVTVQKHGRWLDGRCTNCTFEAEEFFDYEGRLIVYTTDYCPNCGAKMDKEVP